MDKNYFVGIYFIDFNVLSLYSWKIVLEATRGLSHQNDIAVDDIQLWESPCDGNYFHYVIPESLNLHVKVNCT